MRIRTISILTLLIIILAASSAAAALSTQEWKYYKELPAAEGGFALIRTDADIMKNSQEYFADLRITDSQGKEIPSQIIRPSEEEVVSEINVMDAINYPDYSSVIIDQGSNPRPHNRVDLNIKAEKDYLREVKVEASDDGERWGDLAKAKIFSYNGEQSNQISYITSNMRYLRINIMTIAGDKPLYVSSASLKLLPANVYDGKLIKSKIVSQRSDQESSRLLVDLGVPNYIVDTIQIQTANRNYNRLVECATAGQEINTAEQRLLKSEPILAYQWNNYQSVKDSIEIKQFAQRYLILTIYNGSSPPLDIKDIKVYGSQPVMIADLPGPARLWYANPKAAAPNYDLKDFASLVAKHDLPLLTAGTQQLNPGYQAPVVPWTEKNKWLLNLIIVLVAAGFIAIILRKFGQIENSDDKE